MTLKQAFLLLCLCVLAAPGTAASAPDKPGLSITRLLVAPSLGRAGQPLQVTATLANNGPTVAFVAQLSLPPGMRLVSPAIQDLRLGDDDGSTVDWTINAATAAQGEATLRLSAEGKTVATTTVPLHFLAPLPAQKLAYIPPPQPVKTQMLVGALDCPLWESDKYALWDQVLLKHPERTPALGFYAQENPEVADWETKWAVEHGISFFTYCWYRDGQGGPVKTRFGSALHDALFKSRFANQFKFSIMWENQSRGTGVADEHDLLTNLLPYWMNNYFKKPDYLKLDNKPVLFIYRPENLVQDLGGVEQVRNAFAKLRQACRAAGFDGLYILGEYRGLDPNHLRLMSSLGLDYTFAYCWGLPNSPPPAEAITEQMDSIRQTQALNILPEVVTVSQAWSGWHDEGSLWKLPPDDFETLLRQAKAFTATLPPNQLGSRMLLLDNWNEWSEGHYLAPHREYGFGYLDAVRRVFADAPAAHTDLLPSDIGLGPYDTAFLQHLAHDDAVRQLATKTITKAGAPEPGLIGWWAFDEAMDVPVAFDYAGHKLGGTMLSQRAPGLDGSALVCQGGSVQVANNPLLNPSAGLTIEGWVKTDVAEQDNKWCVNKIYGGAETSGYRLGVLGGKPCFEVPLTAWSHHLQAADALPVGRWVYLAGTFDGHMMRIYVDGVERGTMERPGPVKANEFPLTLGNYEDRHPAYFSGLLDEVKLYDHALSAAAVRAHYQRGGH